MKKLVVFALVILVIIGFISLGNGCGSSGRSSSSSYSSSGSSSKSKYDRDAEYVGDQFGKSSDEVKNSVDRMASAMK